MSEQQTNQKPETILDDPSLSLKANRADGMEGEPTLRPSYYENNPRLVVKTKVPNDKNFGTIDAKLSNRAFYSVLRALEFVAESNSPVVIFLDNKGHRFIDKKRDPNPSIMSCIKLEKNQEGVISICISAGKNRPLIEFPFLDCAYHNFRDASGAMPVGMASKFYALGWIDVMREFLPKVLEKNYAKPAWMTRNSGGGAWGGGQQQQNNWGGQQQRQGGQQQQQQNNWNGGGNKAPTQQVSGGNDFNFDDDVPL